MMHSTVLIIEVHSDDKDHSSQAVSGMTAGVSSTVRLVFCALGYEAEQ